MEQCKDEVVVNGGKNECSKMSLLVFEGFSICCYALLYKHMYCNVVCASYAAFPVCHCCTVCEEEPSQAKLAWMRVLERYKENECQLSQEDEGTVPDTQLRSTAKTKSIRQKQDKRQALYLVAGQSHSVWTPRKPSLKQPALTDVVMEVVRNKQDLQERQKRLRSRVLATQLVLKVQREEFEEGGEGEEGRVQTPNTEKRMWRKAITKVMEENTKAKRRKRSKRSLHFHEVVSQYAEKMAKANQNNEEAAESTVRQAKADARRALKQWRSQYISQSKKKKTPLKPFLSVANIPVQQPASQHGVCNTIMEDDSSV